MKKIFLIFFLSSVVTTYSQQVNNGDLEKWQDMGSYQIPDSFYTSDHILFFGDQSVLRTTDARSGQYAALIKNVSNGFKFGTLAYGSYYQSPDFWNYFYGWPFTTRPTKLKFWYKYISSVSDTSMVYLSLSKWDKNINDTKSIGVAILKISSNTINYTLAEIPIDYLSAEIPDTLYISFNSSIRKNPPIGTELYVDDISLEYSIIGLNEIEGQDAFIAFPNPFSDELKISDNGKGEIILFDITGKEILREKLERDLTIDTKLFPKGIYFLRYSESTKQKNIKLSKF